jgi:hypothetical protein
MLSCERPLSVVSKWWPSQNFLAHILLLHARSQIDLEVGEMTTRHLIIRGEYTDLISHSRHDRIVFWRVAVGVSALALITILGVRLLRVSQVTESVLLYAATYCLYYGVALWYALRRQPGGTGVAVGAYVAAVSIVVIVAYLAWVPLEGPFDAHRPRPSISAILATLLGLNWILLRVALNENTEELAALGVRLGLLKSHLLHAVLGGCFVGGYFFFAGIFSGMFGFSWHGWSAVLWTVCLAAGLRSLGEEMFFRGVVFDHIYWMRQGGFWSASLLAAFLNMTVYLVLGLNDDPATLVLTLLSVGILAIVNAFLYRISQSIVPGIISSVLFFTLITLR